MTMPSSGRRCYLACCRPCRPATRLRWPRCDASDAGLHAQETMMDPELQLHSCWLLVFVLHASAHTFMHADELRNVLEIGLGVPGGP